MGDDLQHRLAALSQYYWTKLAVARQRSLKLSVYPTAGFRGEIGRYESEYYSQYAWKRQTVVRVWVQYEYSL